MDMVGISSSAMMAGGLVGSIAAGVLGARLTIKKAPLILAVGSLAIIPIGLVFLFETPIFISYIIITVSTALCLGIIQMAGIIFLAFVQREVPSKLIGKVMSLLVILPFVANGAGSLIYGFLFEWFKSSPWIVVFGTLVLSVIVALYTKSQFTNNKVGTQKIEASIL
jgi:MFS family permease